MVSGMTPCGWIGRQSVTTPALVSPSILQYL